MPLEDTKDFTDAFEQFAAPEDKKVDDKPATEAAPVEGAPTADEVATDKAVDDAAAAAQTAEDAAKVEPVAEEPAAVEAAAEPVVEQPATEAAQTDTSAADDVLAKLAKVVADAGKETKVEDKQVETPATEETPLYTAEEQELIEAHNKEWADLTKAEELKRRGEYRELLQFVFAEVAKALTPLREVTDGLADRTFLADVKGAVPDYSDDLREQVIAWVDKQPAYLQVAYKQVIEQGTVEEVKDLVDRYRGAAGLKVDAGAPTAPKSTGKDKELSSEVKQAASALAPVESKRSGVQQPGDPADFEDAWKQFSRPDASI